MTIIPLQAFQDNYIFAIVNDTHHTVTCVDPGEAEPILSYAKQNGLTLTNVLITHHHTDHMAGISELKRSFPALTVYGPRDVRLPEVNAPVRDEDIVHIDSLAFRVLSIPGHTSSHICYQEPTQGWLFCGDTLFSAGCGRVFDGTIEQLYRSIALLKQLPNDTKVYCGHEYTQNNLRFAAMVEPDNAIIQSYLAHLQEKHEPCSLPSTIALEKQINPFMRIEEPSVQRFTEAHGALSQDPLETFKILRRQKDVF